MKSDKKRIPNRGCPKCGNTVVGCLMEDAQQGYDKEGYFWEEFGTCCSSMDCDWEIQQRSSNS